VVQNDTSPKTFYASLFLVLRTVNSARNSKSSNFQPNPESFSKKVTVKTSAQKIDLRCVKKQWQLNNKMITLIMLVKLCMMTNMSSIPMPSSRKGNIECIGV
jgi:hypothetical protein